MDSNCRPYKFASGLTDIYAKLAAIFEETVYSQLKTKQALLKIWFNARKRVGRRNKKGGRNKRLLQRIIFEQSRKPASHLGHPCHYARGSQRGYHVQIFPLDGANPTNSKQKYYIKYTRHYSHTSYSYFIWRYTPVRSMRLGSEIQTV